MPVHLANTRTPSTPKIASASATTSTALAGSTPDGSSSPLSAPRAAHCGAPPARNPSLTIQSEPAIEHVSYRGSATKTPPSTLTPRDVGEPELVRHLSGKPSSRFPTPRTAVSASIVVRSVAASRRSIVALRLIEQMYESGWTFAGSRSDTTLTTHGSSASTR